MTTTVTGFCGTRFYVSILTNFLCWLLIANNICAGQTDLPIQSPTLLQRPVVEEIHQSPEYAERKDYFWASRLLPVLHAIEGNSPSEFNAALSTFSKRDIAKMSARQAEELLLLTQLLRSIGPTDNLDGFTVRDAIDQLWTAQANRVWSWDSLLALYDMSVRFAGRESKNALRIWDAIDKRFTEFERMISARTISRSELLQYGRSYAARHKSDSAAVDVCKRLLHDFPSDYELWITAAIHLKLLIAADADRWRRDYVHVLTALVHLLQNNSDLRRQHLLVCPHALRELASLAHGDWSIPELMHALCACDQAHFDLIDESYWHTQDQHQLLLYKLQKLHVSILIAQRAYPAATFAETPSVVQPGFIVNHTARLVELCRACRRPRDESLRVHLTHARFLLEALIAGTEFKKLSVEQLRSMESELLETIKATKDDFLLLQSNASPTALNQPNAQAEIVYSTLLAACEWTIQKGQVIQSNGRERELVELLRWLTTQPMETSLRDRATDSLGYLHLSKGDYAPALALFEASPDSQLSGLAIRLLAEKDSGDLQAARRTLQTIQNDSELDLGPITQLIKLYLESELDVVDVTDQSSWQDANRVVQSTSENLADNRNKAGINTKYKRFIESLDTTNQHHQALLYMSLHRPPEVTDGLSRAAHLWSVQSSSTDFYIRARAKYWLAVMGCAEQGRQWQDLQQAQADYKKRIDSTTASPRIESYNELVKTRDQLRARSQAIASSLLENNDQAMDALHAMTQLRDNSYPNLRFNANCLVLRSFLSSNDRGRQKLIEALSGINTSIDQLATEAINIAAEQRTKLPRDEKLGDARQQLFERYRDAFDLAVGLAVEGRDYQRALTITAQSTNQSARDLFAIPLDEQPPPLPQRFIGYYIGREFTVTFWRIQSSEIRAHRANVGRDSLKQMIADYYQQHIESRNNSVESLEAGRDLCKVVMPMDLQNELKAFQSSADSGCVYVLPHGPLYRLPLEVLPISQDNPARPTEYLIVQSPPLVYLPLHGAMVWSNKTPGTFKKSLLTIQPTHRYGGESLSLKQDFEDTGAERFDPESPLSPEDLCTKMAEGFRIIHFGCHGAEPEEDDGAYLQLWSEVKPNRLYSTAVIDRFVLGSQRLNTDLVLLSACESQVSSWRSVLIGGNTIKATGTAFLLAGANHVVASHWKVHDDSTSALTNAFMSRVRKHGSNDLSHALLAGWLREVALDLVGNPEFSSPVHWGAFTLNVATVELDR